MTLKKDLKGVEFGKRKVLYRDTTRPYPVRWMCECQCGRVESVTSSNLLRHPESGCAKCAAEARKGGELTGIMLLWNRARIRAKSRGFCFNITKQELHALFVKQDQKCALSGVPIILPQNRWEFDNGKGNASIDRISSKEGYVSGNVQWVHKEVNSLKRDFVERDLLTWCLLIAEHAKKKLLDGVAS